MSNDEFKPFRSSNFWIGFRGTIAHPDSPVGGGGPGYFRSAQPIGLDRDAFSSLPDPHSPAGRNLALPSQLAMKPATTRSIAWGALPVVTAEFKQRVIEIADEIGINVDWLMAIMAFETGRTFSPSTRNTRTPRSGPVGLLQFTATGARSLGTTKEVLAGMTQLEQLEYVRKWFLPYKSKPGQTSRLSQLEHLYAAVHFPIAVGKPLDFVLYLDDPAADRDLYDLNRGFDTNKDRKVTLGEAAAAVLKSLAEGYVHAG